MAASNALPTPFQRQFSLVGRLFTKNSRNRPFLTLPTPLPTPSNGVCSNPPNPPEAVCTAPPW